MKCAECKRTFSDHLLSPMYINGGSTKPICPLCALEIKNKMHGLNDTKFQGETAQWMLEEAQAELAKRNV